MRKLVKTFVLRIGIDCLGFPQFIKHHVTQYYIGGVSKYFNPYSKL